MKRMSFVFLLLLPVIALAQQLDTSVAPGPAGVDNKPVFPSQKYLSSKSLFIPGIFIAYGFTSLQNDGLINLNLEFKEEIQENHPRFKTRLDNYLMFAPAATAFTLEVSGVKGRHGLKDKLIIYGTGLGIMTATVYVLKKITHQLRPDGSKYNSFPSGHTATAFMSAEFLSREYGFRSHWYSYGGYAAAASTGVLRMYNNKHWFADVVAGAGIGILCTKFTYWAFSKIDNKKKRRALVKY